MNIWYTIKNIHEDKPYGAKSGRLSPMLSVGPARITAYPRGSFVAISFLLSLK